MISEEVAQQYTRRRRQLIPRARLVHHKESPRRLQNSRSPSLYAQFIPRVRSRQELTLLLTPPPDFRTDDFNFSEGSLRATARPEDSRQRQALLDRELFKTSSDVVTSDHERTSTYRRSAPPSDLIGIPLDEPGYKPRPRNNAQLYQDSASHTLKVEYVDPHQQEEWVATLPRGRINDRTTVRSKGNVRNITSVTISDSENFFNSVHHSAKADYASVSQFLRENSANTSHYDTIKRLRPVKESFRENTHDPIIEIEEGVEDSTSNEPNLTHIPINLEVRIEGQRQESAERNQNTSEKTANDIEVFTGELSKKNQSRERESVKRHHVSAHQYANIGYIEVSVKEESGTKKINHSSEESTNKRRDTFNDSTKALQEVKEESKDIATTYTGKPVKIQSPSEESQKIKEDSTKYVKKNKDSPKESIEQKDPVEESVQRSKPRIADYVRKDTNSTLECSNKTRNSTESSSKKTPASIGESEKLNQDSTNGSAITIWCSLGENNDKESTQKSIHKSQHEESVNKTTNQTETKTRIFHSTRKSEHIYGQLEIKGKTTKDEKSEKGDTLEEAKSEKQQTTVTKESLKDKRSGNLTYKKNNRFDVSAERNSGNSLTRDFKGNKCDSVKITYCEGFRTKIKQNGMTNHVTNGHESDETGTKTHTESDEKRRKPDCSISDSSKLLSSPGEINKQTEKFTSETNKGTGNSVIGELKITVDISQETNTINNLTGNKIGQTLNKYKQEVYENEKNKDAGATVRERGKKLPEATANGERVTDNEQEQAKQTNHKPEESNLHGGKDLTEEAIEGKIKTGTKGESEETQDKEVSTKKTIHKNCGTFIKQRNSTMSRRPQVMKITDSATTRGITAAGGGKQDEVRYGSIRVQPSQNQPKSQPVKLEEGESEDNSKNITRKIRSIFEGETEKEYPYKVAPKQTKEMNTQEISPPVENKCEIVPSSTTKPMLIATLSVEVPSDSSEKTSSRVSNSPSPDIIDPHKSLANGKTPAFRAFSCSGEETLSTIGRSVPEYLEATQQKTDNKYTCRSNLQKAHTLERDSKVAAFDGLLQYLQDYRHGLRELLVNNNVVIIEPVRQSKVRLEDRKYSARKSTSESTCRITGATIKNPNGTSNISTASNTLPRQQKSQQPVLRRHFFYHPIRANRELVDEELPDPDKVRHAREMFERTLKMKTPAGQAFSNVNDAVTNKSINRNQPTKIIGIQKSEGRNANKVKRKYLTVDTVFRHNVLHKRWTDSGSLSSGVSSDLSCYETDLESPSSRGETFSRNSSHKEEPTDAFSSDDNEYADDRYSKHCYLEDADEGHYVPPEVMEKIRACGTTVTYYGGQVISASNGPLRSPMTLAIMDEIQKSKTCTKKGKGIRIIQDDYLGVKFRLVKSNSCGSRLELAGTEDDEKCDAEDWNVTEEQSAEEDHDLTSKQETPKETCEITHETSESKQGDEKSEVESKMQEHRHTDFVKSSTIECLDSVFSRINEGRSIFRNTTNDTFLRGGPPKMCFSPEKAKLIEKGSHVFDEMEFEEFEIAEDSLNVIEDNHSDSDKNIKKLEQPHVQENHSGSKEINDTTKPSPEQTEVTVNASQNTTPKTNEDVQMTTWASRSVLFDFRNSGSEGGNIGSSENKSGSNQSSC